VAVRIVVVVIVLAALAGGAYYLMRERLEPPPFPPVSPRAESPPAKPAGPQFPIEPPAKPLPKLGESDPAMLEALSGLFDARSLQRFFVTEDFVRRVVATVDNLPREKIAARDNAIKPLGGAFQTAGRDEKLTFGPRNAARYEPAVKLFEGLDTAKTVETYRHFYPLFQQAYVELGYPEGYFNDRLVEVIDHLLETPEPKAPVILVSPKVMYEYVDPELESMSAGRKILVRMGAQNAARVKAKLKELRAAVVAASSRPAAQ
jgi:hypothetical protein